MSFISLYFHSMDSKNRLFIPAKFRDQLGERFFVMPGAESNLFVYPQETFEEIAEQYRRTHRSLKEQRDFFSNVVEASVDNQGRITLDSRFVEHAELVKETAIVGAGRRIEIWPMEKFKITQTSTKDAIDFSEEIEW